MNNPHFTPEALQFLRDLAENNSREWFRPRKAQYEDCPSTPFNMLQNHQVPNSETPYT